MTPIASRIRKRLIGGRRSTAARPRSRTKRKGAIEFENRRLRPSVTAASSTVSRRRHLLIAAQQRVVADVEAEPARVDDDFGERRHVADAEIETLAGDRVDRMRRLADQRQPAVDIALGQHQPDRVGPVPAHRLDRAEKIAEPGRELDREVGSGSAVSRGASSSRSVHTIERAVPGHRQDRERPRRQKMLDRDAGMRARVPHRRDDRGLRIAPRDRADAGGLAQRRPGAVGGGDEAHADPAPVGQGGGRGRGRRCDRGNLEGASSAKLGRARARSRRARRKTRFSTIQPSGASVPSSRWS